MSIYRQFVAPQHLRPEGAAPVLRKAPLETGAAAPLQDRVDASSRPHPSLIDLTFEVIAALSEVPPQCPRSGYQKVPWRSEHLLTRQPNDGSLLIQSGQGLL